MRVELIYDLPLVDRLPHRQQLLIDLVERLGAANVQLTYLGTSPLAYWRAWKRRSCGDRHGPKRGRTLSLARTLGVPVHLTGPIYEAPCDLGIAFTSQKLDAARLDLPRFGTVIAHYARLPELPGRDALLWSRLLGFDPEVSLFRASPKGFDRGPVLSRHPITTQPADRAAFQTTAITALSSLIATLDETGVLPSALHPGSTAPLLPPLGRRLAAKASRS